MNNFIGKLRLIFVPFLLLAVCVIGGYTFLHWLLFIKLHTFSVNEEILNLYIPIALPWIPIYIWLQPRIKLLNLKRDKGNLVAFYVFISGFALAVPTMIAQSYLETATGKLTQLDSIDQINQKEATKYYTLKKFYIDKKHIGLNSAFDVSGKHNQDFNMHLYLALPILALPEDTANSNCLAWYGIKYYRRISNRLSQKEKEESFAEFTSERLESFDERDVSQFVYLDRIGNTDDHQSYIAAIKKNERYSQNSTTVLMPVNEPFESRNGNKLRWIFGSFLIGCLVWLLMINTPIFDEEALAKFKSGTVEKSTREDSVLGLLLPQKAYFITPVIIDLNLLVFMVMVFYGLGLVSFNAADLITWGANYKPVTTNGQWWRLVSGIFLHGGLMHLLANMVGLIFVGIFLEPLLGRTKYAVIYVVTGIIASITSLWWHSASVSVGASGAIFGLYGVFLALLLVKVFPKEVSKAFLVSTVIFVGYNLVMGLTGGIDNAAHIGGLVSGFIIGLFLSPKLKGNVTYEPIENKEH